MFLCYFENFVDCMKLSIEIKFLSNENTQVMAALLVSTKDQCGRIIETISISGYLECQGFAGFRLTANVVWC